MKTAVRLTLLVAISLAAASAATAQEKSAPVKITYSTKFDRGFAYLANDGRFMQMSYFGDNSMRLTMPSADHKFYETHGKACDAESAKASARAEELFELAKNTKDKDEQMKIMKEGLEQAAKSKEWTKRRLYPTVVVKGTLGKGLIPGNAGIMPPPADFDVVGTIRLHEPAGRDKNFPIGVAILEGEAKRGKYESDEGPVDALVIRNGESSIILTGKVAERAADTTGLIRVTGKLRMDKKSKSLHLEADKIEKADAKKPGPKPKDGPLGMKLCPAVALPRCSADRAPVRGRMVAIHRSRC